MRHLGVLLVLVFSPSAWAQSITANTIRAVGDATVPVKPDLALIDVGVTSQAPTAAAAAADNARKMDRIVAALKKEAGNGGEVKTSGYSVSATYGQPKPGQDRAPIVGYQVSNVVQVRLPDVQAVGRVLDAAIRLGANEVRQVSFSIKDPEPAHAEALKAATLKARAHATAIATALGVKLGAPVTVSEGALGPIPMEDVGVMRMKTMAAATPIEAGTLEVRATVTAIYAIVAK
jgi:uncharacterized protein YggE